MKAQESKMMEQMLRQNSQQLGQVQIEEVK